MDEETQPEAVFKPIKIGVYKKISMCRLRKRRNKNKQIFNLQEFFQVGD